MTDFPIIQYDDDTSLIMEACHQQLFALKAILSSFAYSTGLKVNYAKSNMVLINVSPERLQHLASTFQCKTRSLPFTYLWLPWSHSKMTTQDFLPLVHRVERRLVSTSIFMSQGWKLELVNSLISSLPTIYMCSIKIPIDIFNQIDKCIWHCLWLGGDVNAKNLLWWLGS
jgi:hypothetical protein